MLLNRNEDFEALKFVERHKESVGVFFMLIVLKYDFKGRIE